MFNKTGHVIYHFKEHLKGNLLRIKTCMHVFFFKMKYDLKNAYFSEKILPIWEYLCRSTCFLYRIQKWISSQSFYYKEYHLLFWKNGFICPRDTKTKKNKPKKRGDEKSDQTHDFEGYHFIDQKSSISNRRFANFYIKHSSWRSAFKTIQIWRVA